MVHQFAYLCVIFTLVAAGALVLEKNSTIIPSNISRTHARYRSIRFATSATHDSGITFPKYVEQITSGRGIWKWSNALEAYDRHFATWKGQPIRFGEVGVWSGGSLLMWPAVLGASCHVYGMDIHNDAVQFQDDRTTITILDQGRTDLWTIFFHQVTPYVDILVDDGGHTPFLMMTTTRSVWPHLSPGGVLAIEDIHGAYYLETFFQPVAQYLGSEVRASLASVHVYPFLMIAQKYSPTKQPYDPLLHPSHSVAATYLSSLDQLSLALMAKPPGTLIVLANPTWGDFLSAPSLQNFFKYFIGLHVPVHMLDTPVGCASTNAAVCTSYIQNSVMQKTVSSIHIFASRLVVELAATTPIIQAVRHGSDWVQYPRHS